MGQEVGAYADPSGDRDRATLLKLLIACAFRRPGGNGGRGCGKRHERFGSRRSRFGLRETDVEYETKRDSSTSCSIIRFFYVHRICRFSNKVSLKRRKQPTCQPACTANHHQAKYTHEKYPTKPDLQPDSAADTASADKLYAASHLRHRLLCNPRV